MKMKEYKLKNYSTKIDSEQTIMEIERMLAQFGASHVVKEYDNNAKPKAIMFKLVEKTFKLPNNSEGVKTLFMQNRQDYSRVSPTNFEEQSVRCSWRMIMDWLHAQLSLVATQQAQIEEVMLPYMWDGKRTLYEAYKDGNLQIEDKS